MTLLVRYAVMLASAPLAVAQVSHAVLATVAAMAAVAWPTFASQTATVAVAWRVLASPAAARTVAQPVKRVAPVESARKQA